MIILRHGLTEHADLQNGNHLWRRMDRPLTPRQSGSEESGVALNKEWVLSNLREAKEELERAIREIEGDPDYTSAEFGVVLTEVYEHVNMAWNSREVGSAARPHLHRCGHLRGQH
jgi:hypothetical protein